MQEQIERDLKTALLAGDKEMRHLASRVSHRAGKMEYILAGCSSRGSGA